MSHVIVCPKCQRRYQVKQDPRGRQVKCPSCRSEFAVPGEKVDHATAQQQQLRQRSQVQQAELARLGVGAALPQPPVLFPQNVSTAGAADPLANHVVEDPGFALVDLEEIRERQRAKEAEKFKNPFQVGGKKDLLDSSKHMDVNWVFTSFSGRIPRRSYWMANIGLGFISGGVGTAIGLAVLPISPVTAIVLLGLFEILLIYMSFAISAKRWHDRGKSAWWNLFMFVPIVGAIWALVELGFLRGTKGKNKYGPDPT